MSNSLYVLTQETGRGGGLLYFSFFDGVVERVLDDGLINKIADDINRVSSSSNLHVQCGNSLCFSFCPDSDVVLIEIIRSAKDFMGRLVPIVIFMRAGDRHDYKSLFLAMESALPGRDIRVKEPMLFFLKLKLWATKWPSIVDFIGWIERQIMELVGGRGDRL